MKSQSQLELYGSSTFSNLDPKYLGNWAKMLNEQDWQKVCKIMSSKIPTILTHNKCESGVNWKKHQSIWVKKRGICQYHGCPGKVIVCVDIEENDDSDQTNKNSETQIIK